VIADKTVHSPSEVWTKLGDNVQNVRLEEFNKYQYRLASNKMGSKGGTRRERAFQAMLSGTSFAELLKEFPRSTAYDVLNDFFAYAEPKLDELRLNIANLESQVKRLKGEVQLCESELSEKEKALRGLEKSLKDGEERLNELQEKIERDEARHNSIQEKLSTLDSEGITEEILRKVAETERNSAGELLERVKTFQDYKELQEEKGLLENSIAGLEETEMELKARVNAVKEEVASESNRLDELHRRHSMHEEAIDVVYSLFRDNYDRSILMGIKEALNNLAVKDQPKVSAERLLQGLTQNRKLSDLETDITRKEAELTIINNELEKSKSELAGARDTLVSEIRKTLKTVVNDLNTVYSRTLDNIKSIEETQLTAVKQSHSTHLSLLQEERQFFREEIEKMGNEWRRTALEIVGALGAINVITGEEAKKLAELQIQTAKYEKLTEYAAVMLGVLVDINVLRNQPIENISKLMERISTWINLNHPNTVTQPSHNVCSLESKFMTWQTYQLRAVSKWLTEELNSLTLMWGR
jgi:chromosome segregation ATPase